MKSLKELLEKLNACQSSINWVGGKTLDQAWDECVRADWMIWLARVTDVDEKPLTLAKVKCARLAQHLMVDERSLNALNVAEQFSRGEVTCEKLKDASLFAYEAWEDHYDGVYDTQDKDIISAALIAHDASDLEAANLSGFCQLYKGHMQKQAANICRDVIDLDDIKNFLKDVES